MTRLRPEWNLTSRHFSPRPPVSGHDGRIPMKRIRQYVPPFAPGQIFCTKHHDRSAPSQITGRRIAIALLFCLLAFQPDALYAQECPDDIAPAPPGAKPVSSLSVVGDKQGVVVKKLGKETIRTRYLLEGGLESLPRNLEEEDFYQHLTKLEKKTDTTLLVEDVSSKRVIREIKKESKSLRRHNKKQYSKQDTKNLVAFLESLNFKKKFYQGTRFFVSSGNQDQAPRYTIYAPDGSKMTVQEINNPLYATAVRKFLNYREHWFEEYENLYSEDDDD